MNWKNIMLLLRVERKSGRLIRGIKITRYHENKIIAYWPYWVAAVIGVIGGYLASVLTAAVYADPQVSTVFLPLSEASVGIFATLPTLVLLFCVILTLLQQIQLAGMRATTQINYWLPITWKEQTMASILSNLLGFPLAIVTGMTAGVIVFGALNGMAWQAIVTSLAMFGAAFMASATTEIVRVLQVRFTGAVYKSSGKAAVWVRFIGSLLFFLFFYVIYFSLTYGSSAFIQGFAAIQSSAWFVPFVWLGITLTYLLNGVVLLGVLFVALSAVFIVALYYFAIYLNQRFGLYEPPAISIQKSGAAYVPKTGLLGSLGFSTVEAAIIRKDIRAFTRRRELMGIFIAPIIFVLIPIMQSVNLTTEGVPAFVNLMFLGMSFMFPVGIMAMSLGTVLIGEEGQAVWRIYASPISPKSLVKSKMFFIVVMSILVLIITGVVGTIFYHPSLQVTIVSFIEAVFILMAVGSIALTVGFKGADFSVARRTRMIRQEWSLIGLLVCGLAGVGILAPLAPYVISILTGSLFTLIPTTTTNLAISTAISGIIASVITVVFYRVNINSAKELIRRAEV
ncbi:MAG: hypothetical protein NWE92_12645 [Candidatus Bathyarchaeota archaeon]|nr:hypothetical protein [Candidatus Bathyarchaeota archaeon]